MAPRLELPKEEDGFPSESDSLLHKKRGEQEEDSKEASALLSCHGLLLLSTLALLFLATLNLVCYPQLRLHRVMEIFGADDESIWPLDPLCRSLAHFFGPEEETRSRNLLLLGFCLPLGILSALSYLLCRNSGLPPVFGRGDPNLHLWSLVWVLLPSCVIAFGPQLYTGLVQAIATKEGFDAWLVRLALLANPTGVAAVFALALFLIPVGKHSPLLKVFGLSFTQALVFHRVAGWISLAFTMIHSILFCLAFGFIGMNQNMGFWAGMASELIPPPRCWTSDVLLYHKDWAGEEGDDGRTGRALEETTHAHPMTRFLQSAEEHGCYSYWRNFTGLISTVAFVLLAVASLPRVRRQFYWFFYSVHIPMAWIMMLGAIAHIDFVALILVPNIILYLVTTIPVWVQQFVSAKKDGGVAISSITEIKDSNGCFVLRIPRQNEEHQLHNYGGVCKICLPDVSMIWHPFSTLHDPNELIFLIRGTGPFTKALLDHQQNLPPRILVDGIYPAEHRWHLQSLQHDHVLMVAGGVGIVPFLGLLNELHDTLVQAPSGRYPLRQVTLHWYCREEALARYVCQEFLSDWFTSSTSENGTKEKQCTGNSSSESVELMVVVHVTSLHRDDPSPTSLPRQQHDTEAPDGLDQASSLLVEENKWKESLLIPGRGTFEDRLRGLQWFGVIAVICLTVYWWHYNTYIDGSELVMPRVYVIAVATVVAGAAGTAMLFVGGQQRHDLQKEEPFSELGENSLEQPCRVQRKLEIRSGRPILNDVIASVVIASSPGAIFCGPRKLRDAVKDGIRKECQRAHGITSGAHCAFYDEQSEM